MSILRLLSKRNKKEEDGEKKTAGVIGMVAAIIASAAVIITLAGCMLYCLYLSQRIEERFSGRRWSIPSRVYSDTTILYPGQIINRGLFDEKLFRLGYRQVSHLPRRSGEARTSDLSIELYLKETTIPSHRRKVFPVRILFSENQIVSIEHLDDGNPLSILELEPEELMLFYGPDHERRQLIKLEQVPRHLIYAVLSAEDKRFYLHHGFDPVGILRALSTNLRHGAIRAGGSTITQQLAKCYFFSSKRTIRRKLKELFMAITLEIMCDKNEILEMYLNEIYFGQKGVVAIHGVAEASIFYFGKTVSELSLPEAAAIAGLIRAPNRYSPYVSTVGCHNRRNTVLQAMHQNSWITDAELQSSLSSPIAAVGYTVNEKKAPYFMDYVAEQMEALYTPDVLTSYGLSVYTTLDTQVQMAAELSLEKGLKLLEKRNQDLNRNRDGKKLEGAVIVMQPRSGAILALVGGRNYNKSQFNRITKSQRQPGSVFKPFVYLSALDTFNPISLLSNEHKSYLQAGRLWKPKNSSPVADDKVVLRRALAESINLPTINLAMQLGLDSIINTADTFCFSTRIKPYPSLALGAFEVIPIELARAYCAFAADGVLPYPLSIKDVVNEDGRILERRYMKIERVIPPAKAFIMSSLLSSVVTDGTARSLKNMGISFPVAGKTGTSNDYRDAWFVGYTPDILALVWVGFDDGISLQASGASAALPIWADLIKSIPQYISGNCFKMPPGVIQMNICSESSKRAINNVCPQPVQEVFLADNAPGTYCRLHRGTGRFKKLLKGIYDFFKIF